MRPASTLAHLTSPSPLCTSPHGPIYPKPEYPTRGSRVGGGSDAPRSALPIGRVKPQFCRFLEGAPISFLHTTLRTAPHLPYYPYYVYSGTLPPRSSPPPTPPVPKMGPLKIKNHQPTASLGGRGVGGKAELIQPIAPQHFTAVVHYDHPRQRALSRVDQRPELRRKPLCPNGLSLGIG